MITPPLTRVRVKDLCFFGHHGVLPEEKTLGQRFYISIEIGADMSIAIKNDNYEHAVCYGELSAIAHEVVTGPSYDLIETLAGRIAQAILERCPLVEEARVEVHKPSVPLSYSLRETSAEVYVQRRYTIGFSLGANLGEREASLQAAVDALGRAEGIEVEQVSSLYDSAPWGEEDQAPFINLCVVGQTVCSPCDVLEVCKRIERDIGRVPGRHWGERVVDIDVLFYGDKQVDTSVLTLPHQYMWERAFVLEPLAELIPMRKISGRCVKDALAQLPRTTGDVIRRVS